MLSFRLRPRLGAIGLAATTLALALAPATNANALARPATRVAALAPSARVAAPAPAASATARPRNPAPLKGAQPTPYPIPTLAPLTGETALPYPAYGTPVPGVNAGANAPDVPPSIALQQAVMLGFARSPALASARADVGIQLAAVRLARAGLLPSLAASASYDRSHIQPGGGFSSGSTTGTGVGGSGNTGGTTNTSLRGSTPNISSAAFALQLRQLIYDGGRIAASVQSSQRNETAFADTYRRDLQTVAFNVAVAYYNYLAAQRTVQVDLEIVREDQVQVDLVRAQVRAGTEARAQIATVQLPLAQARLAVVRAQGAELAAEAAFANAMGLDANVRVQPVDDAPIFTRTPVSSIAIPGYDEALRRALALRPDYDAAAQTVAQANYNLRAARLGLFPTLAGSASAQDSSTDASAGSFRNSQSIGLSLSIPIFDQGITAANTAQARATIDKANAQLQNTALAVELNIKQSLTNFVSAHAALEQTQQEYTTATSNVRSTQAQYRAGVTTLPLLLNAQVQLAQALTDQLNAVYALRQAEQTYLYAVGANYDTSAGIGSQRIDPAPAVSPTPTPSVAPAKASSRTSRPNLPVSAEPVKTAVSGPRARR